MNKIPILDISAWTERMASRPARNYYAMYSSVAGGIVTDAHLMLIPVDDHMVHRGDAVFDTCKCVEGRLYNLKAHLERLRKSGAAIALNCPYDIAELSQIVVETIQAGKQRNCLVRILLSRGPGSLGISPYECPEPALYVIVYELKGSFMKLHPEGARAISCSIPVKSGMFANIKTVNYLPNALIKKAAADAKVDFAVNFDERGFLAEGATENMGIVTSSRELRIPKPGRILAGTTLQRVVDLAKSLLPIQEADISAEDLDRAAEILIFGTTPDVTAVIEWNKKPVSGGKPGPVYSELAELLERDIKNGEWLLVNGFSSIIIH